MTQIFRQDLDCVCVCEYDQLFGLGFLLVYTIVVNNHILIIECVEMPNETEKRKRKLTATNTY